MDTEFGPTAGRGIFQIHPSRRCNLRCLHCYSESGPDVDASLPVQVVTSAVNDAADLEYDVMGVSGGEPLLYPGLLEVLETAKARGMTTTVTTNGLLLTPRRLAELRDLVDVLAISLDGMPDSHNRMRNSPTAFENMSARLPGVLEAGIPFGFVFTLTQNNVHEFEWVSQFADSAGASLVQVHPLEPEGFARRTMPGQAPDPTELAFAMIESLRLRGQSSAFIQVDAASLRDITDSPQRFLNIEAVPTQPPGRWLTPLVLETDGTLVPFTYGFPREYAIGSLLDAPMPHLFAQWDAAGLLEVTRRTAERVMADGSGPLLNWYELVTSTAAASV